MDLKPLFEPKTMAVIGISSTNDRHPANVIFDKNNHRYPVEVFGVNPKGGKLHDAMLYQRIADVPQKIDLAVIATDHTAVDYALLRDSVKLIFDTRNVYKGVRDPKIEKL